MSENQLKNNLETKLFYIFSVLFALIFFYSPGAGDLILWLKWMKAMMSGGLYATFDELHFDYPPLSFAILFVAAKGSKAAGVLNFVGLKTSLLIFLLAVSAVFYYYTRDLMLTTLLQLSLTLNSVCYTYLDIYFALPLAISFIMLNKKKTALFTIFFCLSFYIKWQPIILLPFALIHLSGINSFRDIPRIDIKELLKFFVAAVALIIILWLYFRHSFIDSFVVGIFANPDVGDLSGYGLNFNWVLTYFLHLVDPARYGPLNELGLADTITTSIVPAGLVLFLKLTAYALFAFTLYRYFLSKRTFKNFMIYSLLGYLTYFTFFTATHENHLFLVPILLAFLTYIDKRFFAWFLLWSLAANINLFAFFSLHIASVSSTRAFMGVDVTLFLAIFNVILFAIFYYKFAFKEKELAQELAQ